MATRAQKIKVGLFLVVSTILLAGGLLVISGYRAGDKLRFWIEFEESVLGLNEGGIVEYLGVPVGEVEDIYVTEANTALVLIRVDPRKVTLRGGVKARLVLYSIATGTLYISLTGGNREMPELPPGANIPTKPSVFESLRVEFNEALMSISVISDAIRTGLEGMEEGDLTRLIKKAEALATDGQEFLAKTTDTLNSLKDEVAASVADSRELVQDLRALSKDTNEFVKIVAEKVEPLDPAETEKGLQDAIEEFGALSEQLRTTAETFNTVARTVAHKTDNVEHGLLEALESVNETLRAVRGLAEYLQEDPAALLRGKGQPKGER